MKNRICKGRNWRVLAVNLETGEHYVINKVDGVDKKSALPFSLEHFTTKLLKKNKLYTNSLGVSKCYIVADGIIRFHQDWAVYYADSHIWNQVIPDIDIMTLFSNYDSLNTTDELKEHYESYKSCFRINLNDLI